MRSKAWNGPRHAEADIPSIPVFVAEHAAKIQHSVILALVARTQQFQAIRMDPGSIIATYIVASGRNGTLYIGVTSDLRARISRHKQGLFEGFSKKYVCQTLVWCQPLSSSPRRYAARRQ
jgi:predicted GIY-YIG superfamily endonuclease